MQSKDHWEHIYQTKPISGVSWYQEHVYQSLRLIDGTGAAKNASIIDVGGGASTLVDDLLKKQYKSLTVLDLSAAALTAAKERLGPLSRAVNWIEGDILTAPLPYQGYDIWHDRAVFHFLISPEDRRAYVDAVLKAVKPGGHVIVATFAEDGPTQCSGLPVRRYSPNALHDEFGSPFTLLVHEKEDHHTPFGSVQKFIYCYCRKASSETGKGSPIASLSRQSDSGR